MLITKGFASVKHRSRHFQEHGDDFRAGTAEEYEILADVFLTKPHCSGMHEHTRRGGDRIRYDAGTNEFGVVDASGIIRTYFKPVPCSSLPAHLRVAAKRSGRCHGHANNVIYFKVECKRW